MKTLLLVAAATLALAAGRASAADVKVELKGTHLCCGQCVKAANDIIKKVDGCTGVCDQKGGSIALTAKDDETAQKAIDALAAGGFHGTTDSKTVKVKDDSGASKGNVKTLTLEGVHDCCGQCNTKIVNAVKAVEGVKGNTAKAKADTFDVTGDFDALALVEALNKAGFHVKVKAK
jgi:hypothetical protein